MGPHILVGFGVWIVIIIIIFLFLLRLRGISGPKFVWGDFFFFGRVDLFVEGFDSVSYPSSL